MNGYTLDTSRMGNRRAAFFVGLVFAGALTAYWGDYLLNAVGFGVAGHGYPMLVGLTAAGAGIGGLLERVARREDDRAAELELAARRVDE